MIAPRQSVFTFPWNTALATVIAALLLSSIAVACSCDRPPSPCEAWSQSPLVFLGTITEILPAKGERIIRARMRIDHSYKGVTEASVTLFDDGMCDGPTLQAGEQYLMYTGKPVNGLIPSRGCTRGRHVKFADEDLKFLNGLSDAPLVSTIFGRVATRTDDSTGKDQPLVGAQVEISGPHGTYLTTTDVTGHYGFDNLPPDTYTLTSASNGLRMLLFGAAALSATRFQVASGAEEYPGYRVGPRSGREACHGCPRLYLRPAG